MAEAHGSLCNEVRFLASGCDACGCAERDRFRRQTCTVNFNLAITIP